MNEIDTDTIENYSTESSERKEMSTVLGPRLTLSKQAWNALLKQLLLTFI